MMNRVVIVTECGRDQEFTRDEVAKMLRVYPERVINYWIEESREGSIKVHRLLAEIASV